MVTQTIAEQLAAAQKAAQEAAKKPKPSPKPNWLSPMSNIGGPKPPGEAAAAAPTTQATVKEGPATPALYSPEYYDLIRQRYMGQASSPAAQETARQERSRLAGLGVLSGSAYDVAQRQRYGQLSQRADEAVGQAMLEGARYKAEAPERERAEIESQLSLLQPIVAAGGADEATMNLYNELMQKRFGITPKPKAEIPADVAPGQYVSPQEETQYDFAGMYEPAQQKTEMANEIITAQSNFEPVYEQITYQLNTGDLEQSENVVQDFYSKYQPLANKLDAIAANPNAVYDPQEIATLNKWTQAFQQFLASVNPKTGTAMTNAAWASIKQSMGLV